MLHRKLHKKCFLEQKGMTCNHTSLLSGNNKNWGKK